MGVPRPPPRGKNDLPGVEIWGTAKDERLWGRWRRTRADLTYPARDPVVAGFKTCSSKYWRTSLTLSSSDGRSNSTISSNLSLIAQSNWSGWLLARTNINLSMRKKAHPLNMRRVPKRVIPSRNPEGYGSIPHLPNSRELKVMLPETILTMIFSATQRCNIVAALFRTVTTLFQHCSAVLC